MANFTCNIRDGALLAKIEVFHTLVTEMVVEEIIHNVVEVVKGVILFGLVGITYSLVLPIVQEKRVVGI